ncbi:starvation-inducible DNA-binding protein [Agreia bicolorata]|uniref:Starvation-inducible DNA-binding protein n=1 Tax=Agreia bicolorata TaxID=110935 RepID=A0A1T4YJG1_9MICO|nr:DNA starvation/stationary phase protection protein [Agreia bicolorata]SKB01401.1 starvation-inducible DNA-binding protein [Agreia bicolorata]
MTNTTVTVPTSSTSPDVAAATAQFLAPIVVDLQALAINGKQAHWHVRGANFIGVHELLDNVVSHAQDWADLAAERVVALGLPLDARIDTVAAKTVIPTMEPGFQRSEYMIAAMVAQIDATLVGVRKAITELNDIDLTSQDVVLEIARGLEKSRWFLAAHIAE